MKESRRLMGLWAFLMTNCLVFGVVVVDGSASKPKAKKVGNSSTTSDQKSAEQLQLLPTNHSSPATLDDVFVLGPTTFPKPTSHLYLNQRTLPMVVDDPSDIAPRPEPSSLLHLEQPLQHRPEQDAILVFAMQYDWKVYMLFLETLQDTGYTGDVVLAMEPSDLDKAYVRDYLTSHIRKQQQQQRQLNQTTSMNTVIYTIQLTVYNFRQQIVESMKGGSRGCRCHEFYQHKPTGTPLEDTRIPRPPATLRYEIYWIWSLRYQPSSWLLVVDARDTIFQSNPFSSVLHSDMPNNNNNHHQDHRPNHQLHFFGENQDATRLGQSNQNKRWLQQAYSEEFVEAVHDQPILCSGATMGEQAAMEIYFRAIVNEHDETLSHLSGADQGFHNYLYYSRKLFQAIANITVFPQGTGVVNHIGAMRTKSYNAWGNGQMVQFHPPDPPTLEEEQQPAPVKNLTSAVVKNEKRRKKLEQQLEQLQLKDVPVVYNWNGQKSPVVHQFDRFDDLGACFFKNKLFQYFNKWKLELEEQESASSS